MSIVISIEQSKTRLKLVHLVIADAKHHVLRPLLMPLLPPLKQTPPDRSDRSRRVDQSHCKNPASTPYSLLAVERYKTLYSIEELESVVYEHILMC
jgi:hypothetical protein